MENRRSVILDAGHGGAEPGAMYQGRREKDDTLRLALAVGEKLENRGVDVMYTRTTDVYDSPLERRRLPTGQERIFLSRSIGTPCRCREREAAL